MLLNMPVISLAMMAVSSNKTPRPVLGNIGISVNVNPHFGCARASCVGDMSSGPANNFSLSAFKSMTTAVNWSLKSWPSMFGSEAFAISWRILPVVEFSPTTSSELKAAEGSCASSAVSWSPFRATNVVERK